MKNSSQTTWNGCPIRYAAGIIGDRWNLLIIRDLMLKGRRYYGELLDGGESISTNILANRLARLCSSGIVEKSQDSNDKKKYIYTLTTKGTDLIPVFMAMIEWSQQHDKNTQVSSEYIARMNKSPSRFRNRILADMRKIDQSLLENESDS